MVCRDKHMFVATKHVFCCDKYLSWQTYFVATNIILSWQMFCRGKHTFVARKDVFCRDKHVCRDKNDTCGNSRQWHMFFVATKECLSRQNYVFVARKIILVAGPANASFSLPGRNAKHQKQKQNKNKKSKEIVLNTAQSTAVTNNSIKAVNDKHRSVFTFRDCFLKKKKKKKKWQVYVMWLHL